MSDVDHSAVGPALGYAYQFDRAAFRLLEADDSVVHVGVEHLDDVSVQRADGTSIHEQDKATIGDKRALSDRSVALWKTLGIWAERADRDPSLLDKAEFHLVTNGEMARDCLASRLHAATVATHAGKVAAELLAIGLSVRDELRPFAEQVTALGAEALATLILRISVFDRITSACDQDLALVPSLRYLGRLQRASVFNNAVAFVKRHVLAAAKEARPTTVDRAAFDREVRALLRHASVAPLAVLFEAPASELDPSQYKSHGFFRQLDWVDTDPGLVRDCVVHFARARYTRAKWAETEEVSESSLRMYEGELEFRWKLLAGQQAKRQYESASAQGQELLTQTLSQDSSLQGQALPKAFTCGSFHALADFDLVREPIVGWHPEFRRMADAQKRKT
jgi:hypothetical protein